MEQALLFPQEVDERLTDVDFWNRRLDSLCDDKSLWVDVREELRQIPAEAKAILAQYAASGDRETILHLAVLDDELETIALFNNDRTLQQRRNRFGLTPIELARYLHKQKSVSILTGAATHRSFFSQPGITFEDTQLLPQTLEYLKDPVFESAQVLDEVFTYTERAKSEDAIPNDRIWLGVYFNHEIELGICPKMAVRHINPQIGFGVFARERILPCSYVGEYTGLIQERTSKHINESNYCFRYTAWAVGKRRYVVDSENMGNFTRFINHSDDPNTTLICAYWRGMPRLIFISLKEIAEGAQITFDYGKIFWKQSPHIEKLEI